MTGQRHERASFAVIGRGGRPEGDPVRVHFNPVSLQYRIANTIQRRGRGTQARQYVSQTTARLDMELVFDTTDTGADVREDTVRLQDFLRARGSGRTAPPPVVEFVWGTYRFRGIVESYEEVLDFFAAEGVPLRATVRMGLQSQRPEDVFAAPGEPAGDGVDTGGSLAGVAPDDGRGTTGVASGAGDARAGRAIASANGAESMRFPGGGNLAVGGGVTLRAAVGFQAGAGIAGGASIGVGGGVGAGVSVGAGGTASAGLRFGASASAGVSAGAGAFAGLRAGAAPAPRLTAGAELPTAAAGIATDAGAGFQLGGQARTGTAAGLRAEVGAGASLRDRLQFED